jgi:hypothetical protein
VITEQQCSLNKLLETENAEPITSLQQEWLQKNLISSSVEKTLKHSEQNSASLLL